MSDSTQSNQTAPAGQPGTTPAGEQPSGQQQYLTRDDALTLVREELRKTSQSTVDRISAQVQKVITAAAQRGVTLTADQAQAVIDASTPKAQEEKTPAASQQPPAAQPQAQGQQPSQGASLDPVTKKAVNILSKEFGLTVDPENLDDNDPDTKLINLETDDPEEFFASVRAYGKVKKEKADAAGTPAVLPGLASGGKTAATNPYEGKKGSSILSDYYTKHT